MYRYISLLLPPHLPPDEGGIGEHIKMASSIMHMAVTKLTAEKLEIKVSDRLLKGAALPDFCADKNTNSHLKFQIRGGTKNIYSLSGFRDVCGRLMSADDLYLGYYLHIVQDMIFRDFVYKKHHWNPHIPGNTARLHNDYRIINAYLIEKYGLRDRIVHPALEADFTAPAEGGIFFFTKEMTDDYIQICRDVCEKELDAFFRGQKYIDEYELAWDAKPQSLLETTSNTRELGGYRTKNGGFTLCGRIIRSDVPMKPNEGDIAFLSGRGINTIIDLRTEREAAEVPNPFDGMQRFLYHGIPIDEGGAIPESADAVSESYMEIAGAANIGEVFRCIANAPDGVLFHCAAGKDRTGVVSAILLMLAGVSDAEIAEDYMLTKEYNGKRLEAACRKYPADVIEIITPNERYIYEFLSLFREKYGCAEKYLKTIGVSAKEIKLLKNKLLE